MVFICLRLFRSRTLCVPSLSRFRAFHPCQRHTGHGRLVRAPWISYTQLFLSRTHIYDLQMNSICSSRLSVGQKTSLSVPVLHEPVQKLHTSARLHVAAGPLLLLLFKPLQKLTAIILGRSIRKLWKNLPPNKKQLFQEWAKQWRWYLAGAGTGLLLLIVLFFHTHLEKCPVTGRSRLLILSREKFLELSQYESDKCMEEYGSSLVPLLDPRHQVVKWLVQTLAHKNEDVEGMTSVAWTVHVVENARVNAFVLPAEQASLSHVVDLLSMALLTVIWAICPQDSLALLGQWVQGKLVQLMFNRPFSRKLEAEADEVGLKMAAKACADVRAGSVFWLQMELADQLGGQRTVPEWLSSHPSHSSRIKHLDRLIPEALELREKCHCPALPVTDPRSTFNKSMQLLHEKHEIKVQEKNKEIQLASVPQQRAQNQLGGVLATSALPSALLNHKDLAQSTVTLK